MNAEVKPGYKQTEAGVIPVDWLSGTLGQFISLRRGHDLTHRDRRKGTVPVMGSAGQNGFHNVALAAGPGVTLGRSGASFGQAHFCSVDYWPHNTALYVTDFQGNDPLFIYYFLTNIDFSSHNTGGAQQSLNRNFIYPIPVALPRTCEQKEISTALSDMDALISSLDRLIAKKSNLQQATMQQLLTGQRRLPGFGGAWEVKSFSQVLKRINVKAHQIQTSDYLESAKYPIVDQGKDSIVGFSDSEEMLFRNTDDGVIVFGDHTCIVKFVNFDFLIGADGTQVIRGVEGQNTRFHAFQLQHRGVEPTGYNRHFKFLKERTFQAPPLDEQNAITAVLSDMDTELAALETLRDKARQLKQGTMQELLTGRIRLI